MTLEIIIQKPKVDKIYYKPKDNGWPVTVSKNGKYMNWNESYVDEDELRNFAKAVLDLIAQS